eukprot:PITA_13471
MRMDVCHILLGRPWQYDRKVIPDGETNCYKFVKDWIKDTLVPIKEEDATETSGTKALLLGGKESLQHMEDDKEFSDILVDDLPNKLPPKWSISHHIDFIPRASLPSKVAYRMSSKDNEEIRKQVQVHEVLDEGLIQESLGPCAVPTVLSPKKGGEWWMCTNS